MDKYKEDESIIALRKVINGEMSIDELPTDGCPVKETVEIYNKANYVIQNIGNAKSYADILKIVRS